MRTMPRPKLPLCLAAALACLAPRPARSQEPGHAESAIRYDGMEHRNSTVLTSTGSLEGDALALLGTVAHEFFHVWNMERIRAAALEPFDFDDAVMSAELWFDEGFTSYYDDLAMARAGLIPLHEFARRMGGLVDAVANGPGREIASPVEMSRRAPFVDAAVSVDPTNRVNTFISYYTWGHCSASRSI